MRVWLVTVGEPLPTDGGVARLFRTGMTANELLARGHDVVWWTSAFDHFTRQNRFESDTAIETGNGCKLWLLHGPEYKKSISWSRLKNHHHVAKAFEQLSEGEASPDVILCSMPTIELAVSATKYGKENGVPVILDIRDLWPDIIVDQAPKGTRWLARAGLNYMFRQLRQACQDATAITGITDGCVDWALAHGRRSRTLLDRSFALAYSAKPPSADDLDRAHHGWHDLGVGRDPEEFTICFFGPISRRYELRDVVKAAKIVEQQRPKCRFVICGNGEDLPTCKRLAASCNNVSFPGWVGAAEIWSLLRIAKLGLVPHPSTRDYMLSLPNKSIECLSGGLPVVTSLSGTLQRLLEEEHCGVRYPNGDYQALAQIVCDLYDSPDRVRELSANATRVFQDRFTAQRVYGEMCEYLVQIAVPRTIDRAA